MHAPSRPDALPSDAPPGGWRAWRAVAAAVAGRPRLWPAALRQVVVLAPRGWWRRPPFLPQPDRDYRRFRSLTQYGDATRVPSAVDVVGYLDWCRQFHRLRDPGGPSNSSGRATVLR